MIPTFSDVVASSPWLENVRRRTLPLVDHERGGVAIGDTSTGLSSHEWTAFYEDGQIKVKRDDADAVYPVLTRAGVTHLGLAFDQNMRVTLCFTDGDGSWLWYYSAGASSMVFLALDGITPCICLDEKRESRVSYSDVIVSYMNGNDVRCRVQREGYANERTLGTLPNPAILTAFAMTTRLRLQWRFKEL